MALIRLNEPYDTDLLITYNVPDKHTSNQAEEYESGSQEVGQSQAYKQFLATTEL